MNPEDFIKEYEASLATQQWPKVAPLIHEDACVTFSSGTVHKGKEAVQHAFEKNFKAIQSEKYSINHLHWVRKEEDLAIYLFDFHWSGILQGKSASGHGRGTAVLVKTNECWQLLIEHLGPG